ncbi:hypothetical protein [Prauserella marina]|nr:hypothetical protein [Prauserella marina]
MKVEGVTSRLDDATVRNRGGARITVFGRPPRALGLSPFVRRQPGHGFVG